MFVNSGAGSALVAAFGFGISPVFMKLFSAALPPVLTAGVLYLGSGIGLLVPRLLQRESLFPNFRNLPLRQKIYFAGVILCGGILAPVCFATGVLYSPAFQAAALINTETVFTTLIAWLIFHERVTARLWLGKVFILSGALIITLSGTGEMTFNLAGLWVVAACFFWSVDNNLTRDLRDVPPILIAIWKGMIAGVFNITLAFLLNQRSGDKGSLVATFVIGIVCYGLSLLFLIFALRKIGAARALIYFSTAPFAGMIGAVLLLGERPSVLSWLAGGLMLFGVATLYKEQPER